jgi:hypothetical protein
MVYRVVFLFVFASMSVGTYGADIFKWVDEKGQIHYGQSVPKQYKGSATKIVLEEVEPTDAQRHSAEARAAKDKARAESIVTPRAESNKPHSDSPPLQAAAGTDDKESRCAAEKKKYRKSQACFAPYRTANGGLKPEAFQHCVEVKEPIC